MGEQCNLDCSDPHESELQGFSDTCAPPMMSILLLDFLFHPTWSYTVFVKNEGIGFEAAFHSRNSKFSMCVCGFGGGFDSRSISPGMSEQGVLGP